MADHMCRRARSANRGTVKVGLLDPAEILSRDQDAQRGIHGRVRSQEGRRKLCDPSQEYMPLSDEQEQGGILRQEHARQNAQDACQGHQRLDARSASGSQRFQNEHAKCISSDRDDTEERRVRRIIGLPDTSRAGSLRVLLLPELLDHSSSGQHVVSGQCKMG